MEKFYQYETAQWSVKGKIPADSLACVDIRGIFRPDGESTSEEVYGFYAEDGTYIIRFYPGKCGIYHCRIEGNDIDETQEFDFECLPKRQGKRGMVRADGTHFKTDDGQWFYPFGTTVYAMIHQDDSLAARTLQSLKAAPFNKIRICVFPKHFEYNHNEPPCFPFERADDGSWDVNRPDAAYWERLEDCIKSLDELGIQCDLILFHSYDRWGFSELPVDDALVYLDYVVRRLGAFANVWWSLANEFDLMKYKQEDWELFAHFIHEKDPYGHLLSCHQMLREWDYSNKDTTHICTQTSALELLSRKIKKYNKPLMVDECGYEGNLPISWGNLSAFGLVHRFWTVCVQGGYCTHGETFFSEDEVIWWAKGGRLKGQSPERIGFLKGILEEIGGPLEYAGLDFDRESFNKTMSDLTPEMIEKNEILMLFSHYTWEDIEKNPAFAREYIGRYGDKAFLKYYGRQCPYLGMLVLPEDKKYKVEAIDVWEMKRWTVLEEAAGEVFFELPSKEGMAVLAVRI